jgi:hypothetical protein
MESLVEVLLVIGAFAAIQGTVMAGRYALIAWDVSDRTREKLGVAFVALILLAGLLWIGWGGSTDGSPPAVHYDSH